MSGLFENIEIILTIIAAAASILNIAILAMLFRDFLKSYNKLKAKFTKGLLTFVGFLLFQQLCFLFALIMGNVLRPDEAFRGGGPIFLLNVMELVALIIFYRTTRE